MRSLMAVADSLKHIQTQAFARLAEGKKRGRQKREKREKGEKRREEGGRLVHHVRVAQASPNKGPILEMSSEPAA